MVNSYQVLKVLFAALLFMFSMQSVAAPISQNDPAKMVDELSQELIKQINEQRADLEAHPEHIRKFADEYVLPYVDTAKMARYVMGKFWRSASKEQQTEFVEEFSNTLIRSYSKSMLKLQIDEVIVRSAQTVKPGRVTVSSVITQVDGNKTDVVYRAFLNKKTNHWMLYDVTIEGISMLLNYRKAYASDFSKKGVDAVILDMKAKNQVLNGSV